VHAYVYAFASAVKAEQERLLPNNYQAVLSCERQSSSTSVARYTAQSVSSKEILGKTICIDANFISTQSTFTG